MPRSACYQKSPCEIRREDTIDGTAVNQLSQVQQEIEQKSGRMIFSLMCHLRCWTNQLPNERRLRFPKARKPCSRVARPSRCAQALNQGRGVILLPGGKWNPAGRLSVSQPLALGGR